ncbi:MAG TPA: MFS transporter [Candidatus Polarisedimenticolia bacterium]|nr:MFS transporter [Candidatus Polarisedimenticolia bacterium]
MPDAAARRVIERSSLKRRASNGPLDKILGVFAEVREGEGVTAILLLLNMFLLLAAYYLLKTIREPLILNARGGAEVKSYSAAATAGLLILLVPLYSAVASRVSRVKLINGVTLCFIACLVAFYCLGQAGVPIGVPFFIWVGIFSLMMVAQIWAFAADVYTVNQGKRLFAIVGFGSSLGAIAGSFATGQLVARYGPHVFMLGAAALLGVCLLLTNAVDLREKRTRAMKPREPTRERNGFSLVFANRYLLLIALLMLLYNLVNTTGEYILGKTVVTMYERAHGAAAAGGLDESKMIGEFYGNFFTLVNVFSALLQAFVVSRVIKYFGVRVALLVLPVVALAGYAGMAFLPLLLLIRTAKLAENSIDYSLQNTTRNALYLPTSREEKYKAKQANDAFFHRFGDVLSAGLVFAGTRWFSFGPRQFALVNVALIIAWLVLAVVIGRQFERLSTRDASRSIRVS